MTRNEFLVFKRLEALQAIRDVVMTLDGDYALSFSVAPDAAALAALGFTIVKQTGKKFVLHDTTPPTHPLLMNAAEQAIYDRLAEHYGHIGSVSASADHGFVVQLMGGQLDEAFLDDVVHKTGLLVINHNHSSFTVRIDEPVATVEGTVVGLYPQPAQVDAQIAALEAEPEGYMRPCADCEGTGTEANGDYVRPCSTCGGTGIHTEAEPDDGGGIFSHAPQDQEWPATEEAQVNATLDAVSFLPNSLYATATPGVWQVENYGMGAGLRRQLEAAGLHVHSTLDDTLDGAHYALARFALKNSQYTPIDAQSVADELHSDASGALSADASETDDTAWATPGLRAALDAVLAVHEFYPAEIHPTAATHHWLIENRGRKEFLRGRLVEAGLAVVYVTQDYLDDTPYSLATIHFDGTPDLVAPPLDEDATADDTLADLRTCVSLLSGMNSLLEGRLAEAHAINQAQSNLIRDAIMPTLEAKPPRRLESEHLIQDLDDTYAEVEIAQMRNAGWNVVSEIVNTYIDAFTDGIARVKHIRIVRLERELPNPQPQPVNEAAAEAVADPLFSRLARNGAHAPAPRPGARVIIEQAVPLGNPAFNGLPNAQSIHRDGLEAWKQERKADIGDAIMQEFVTRQAARTPVAPNPFRIPSSVGGAS